jgi:uncharacterized Tic20 family protein
MTTTPPEEPQQPTPPPPSGYTPPPAGGYTPPPAYNAPPPAYGAAAPISDSDQRTWSMLAHLSGFLSIIATIAIWAIYKDKGAFVKEQATEALNFQILAVIVGVAISIIATLTLGIGSVLFLAMIVFPVFMILAAVATNKGEAYRYPINWRIIK